jgi:hypothetical protein
VSVCILCCMCWLKWFRTSTMAEDVVCLLDHVGWTREREVHVVGISLGGMIAQGELLCGPNGGLVLMGE